jgi:hypothetical protein
MPFTINPNSHYASVLSAANELEAVIGKNAAKAQMQLIQGGTAQGNVAQINAALKTLNAMAEQTGKSRLAQEESRNKAVDYYNSNVGEAIGKGVEIPPNIQAQIDKAKSKGDLNLAASMIKGAINAPQGADGSDAAKKEKDAKELKIRQLTQRLTSTQNILNDPELGDTFGRSLPVRKYQEYTSGTGSQIRAQLESLKGSFLSGGLAEMKAGAGSTGNPSAIEAEAIAKSVSPLSLEMPVSAAMQELKSITNKTIRSLKELGANPAIYTEPDTLKKYNESPDASPFDTSVDVAKPTPANATGAKAPIGSGVVNKPMSLIEAFNKAR